MDAENPDLSQGSITEVTSFRENKHLKSIHYGDDQKYPFVLSGKRIFWVYSEDLIIDVQITVGNYFITPFEEEIDVILETIIVR